MQINLKLRAVTAYCSPTKAILADNEDLTIKIVDKGQLKQRVVLLCNGKSFVADGNKEIVIPRAELGDINVFELTERETETDKVLKRFTVENLYVLPCDKEYAGSRLLVEREFYQQTFKALLEQVDELSKQQVMLKKKVAELENGKFTMLKFGGNKQ